MTKGADCPDMRLGTDCRPQSGNTRGLGPVTPASRGELTRRPLTPPPRKFHCSEPQSKTKGRGEEGATVPSNHRWPPSPEPRARSPEPQPEQEPRRGSSPGSPLAADQGPGSPWSPVSPRPPVTGAGEAAEGQPGMGKPDGSIPPPSSSIPPSGCPRAWPPSAGARGGRGPGSSGLTPGKGLPLSKGHHPSAVPGLGLVPPIPRPRGWRWGAAPNLGR